MDHSDMVAQVGCNIFWYNCYDALLAYNYEHSTSPMTVHEFANDLASSLIFNHFDGHVPEQSQKRRQSSDQSLSHHQILWIHLFPTLLEAWCCCLHIRVRRDQKKVHVANVLFAQLTGKGKMHITTVRHVRIFLRVP